MIATLALIPTPAELLGYAWVLLVVILLFGMAIFVHEFGHFLAARRLGLVVDTFSIGFGPALWKRTVGGVVYKVCVFPFGGYVALPQLDPSGMDAVQGENAPDAKQARVLPNIAPWRRIVVACAGPAGNIVLSFVLAWLIYLVPHAVTGAASTQIGTVDEDTPAWQAGLRPGQTIERVNGERVGTWYDFMVECHLAGDPRQGVRLSVRDGARVRDLHVPLATNLIAGVSVVEGIGPKSQCFVEDVVSNSPAAVGGVLAGDRLRAVNGVLVMSASQFFTYMKANGSNAVNVELVRNEQPVTVRLTPRLDATAGRPLIGVRPRDALHDVPAWMQYSKPGRQLEADASMVVRILRALILPQNKGESKRAAAAVGGPLLIIVTLWHAVQSGILNSLGLLRMIGINLAIINLLPIPVLDGGHVVFALWEQVTRRKPHPKVVSTLVNAFAVLLIGLMLLLVWRDAMRMRQQRQADARADAAAHEAAVTNAAPAAAATNSVSGTAP